MDDVSEPRFLTIVNHRQSHLVVERATGRCLGGVAVNHYRPFVFPLYSPRGYTVIAESPPDHPFHNGVFVGQQPVLAGDREANFWATPPRTSSTDDQLREHMGRMETREIRSEEHDSGVRFVLDCIWVDENEEPVLDETRTIDLYVERDGTVCDMVSTKTAAYGSLVYPPTKHGSVGMRVEQRLLPDLGGIVIGDQGRRGRADIVHEQESAYVAYESVNDAHAFGVLITVLHDDVSGVWFARDYGMVMYDSTLRQEILTEEGEAWSVGVRVVAYDGSLDDERARRWIAGDRRAEART